MGGRSTEGVLHLLTQLSRHVEIARTWSQTGSRLAFNQLSTGLRHAHDTRMQVCDQVCNLDSVMEFGVKGSLQSKRHRQIDNRPLQCAKYSLSEQ